MRKIITILILVGIFACKINAINYQLLTDNSKANNNVLYKAIAFESSYYAASLFILQKTWYKGKDLVPFHFYNDNKGYLQVDKFGHAFGAYFESYIGYQSLMNSGLAKNKALIYGGTLGLILQTPIEIMDGIHEGWGFSWGDMAANTFGSGLLIGQELLFNEQIVKYKFSYWESTYLKKTNGLLGETAINRLLKDYNGHTYWLSMPISCISQQSGIPLWLNFAVGYGANGMLGEYENLNVYNGFELPTVVRYRQYLLSLDVDWTKIKTRSKFLNHVLRGMTFIKLPFPAVEYNSAGKFKAYWLYY